MGLADKVNKVVDQILNPAFKLRPEILLLPNIPQPLHGVNPRTVLGNSWWNKTKKEAKLASDNHCVACGVSKMQAKSRQWVECHEVYDTDYKRGRLTYIETVTLCHYCHMYIHDGRMKHLMEKGQLHQQKYVSIIQHGDRILMEAGLERLPYKEREENVRRIIVDGNMAEWSKWRMVVDGVEYPPLYKNYKEWEEAHK